MLGSQLQSFLPEGPAEGTQNEESEWHSVHLSFICYDYSRQLYTYNNGRLTFGTALDESIPITVTPVVDVA